LDLSHLAYPLDAASQHALCEIVPKLLLLHSISLHVEHVNVSTCFLVALLAESGTCSHFLLHSDATEEAEEDSELCWQVLSMHTLTHVKLQIGQRLFDADDVNELSEDNYSATLPLNL
jgi:hypothetical protein